MTSKWPFPAARAIAENPSSLAASLSAPASSNIRTTSKWPSKAAMGGGSAASVPTCRGLRTRKATRYCGLSIWILWFLKQLLKFAYIILSTCSKQFFLYCLIRSTKVKSLCRNREYPIRSARNCLRSLIVCPCSTMTWSSSSLTWATISPERAAAFMWSHGQATRLP